jgi:hypothetical protein
MTRNKQGKNLTSQEAGFAKNVLGDASGNADIRKDNNMTNEEQLICHEQLDDPQCGASGGEELKLPRWLQIRRREGRKIDPETAEVRRHSVRSPGSKLWVHFYDLPEATLRRLYDRCGDDDHRLRDAIEYLALYDQLWYEALVDSGRINDDLHYGR